MRSGFAAVFGAALVLAGTSGAGGAASSATYQDPAWSPNGKRIAFVGGTVDGDLFVMNADGTHVRQLTNSSHESGLYAARWPTWSPSGRKLAFGYGYDGIWVINADGTGLRRIVDDGCCAAWSPGGRHIAFSAPLEAGAAKVWVVDPDGGKPTLVAKPPDFYSFGPPAWSRDGQRLAFGAGTAPDTGIVPRPFLGIVSQYRGRVVRVAVGHTIYTADWSRDGRRILLAQDPKVNNPRRNVWISVLDLRTKKIKKIRKLKYGISARWSPNNRRIVFADRGAIYVMNADGSHLRRLAPR